MKDVRISLQLLMKAAKIQQNHKVKAETVVFDAESEIICFLDTEDKVVATAHFEGRVKC